MEHLKIKDLNSLKEWNKNPTVKKPIVLEWFMDWFFDDVLMKDKKELALDAYNTMIEFTMICEKMSKEQAIDRVHINLGYYSGYSSKWSKKLKKHFPNIL